MSGMTHFFVIPAVSEPAPVVIGRGGYPSVQTKDSKGCRNDVDEERFPIKNVGNDRSLPSYPRLVAGIHPKGNQDGFPITNVGNDKED
jgi:hypothetical protein